MSAVTTTVHLIPFGMSQLPQFQLLECQNCVRSELAAISELSDRAVEFSVVIGAPNATRIPDDEIPVYLLTAQRASSALTLAKERMPECFEDRGTLPRISQQLQIEFASTLVSDDRSISFVIVDRYLTSPVAHANQLSSQKHYGRALGHTILHELAHCLGVSADDYFDDMMKPGFPGRKLKSQPQPSLRFSDSTRRKMIAYLLNRSV